MKILFCGTTSESKFCLNLLNEFHDVSLVITKPESKRSRGSKVSKTPVHEYAIEHNINVLTPASKNDILSSIPLIKEQNFDMCIVVSYGMILPMEFINLFKSGCWNIHFSLLPKYRGAAPVEHTILNAEDTFGFTIFQLDKGCDTGPIVYKSEKMIFDDKYSSQEIRTMISKEGANKLIEILKNVESIKLKSQTGDSSHAGFLHKNDFKIVSTDSMINIISKIRLGNAWLIVNDKVIKVLSYLDVQENDSYYKNTSINSKGELLVQNYKMILDQIVPASKNKMSAKDYFRQISDDTLIG